MSETTYTIEVSLYFLLRHVALSDPVSNMHLLSSRWFETQNTTT
jgi:hypothetical protein